MEIIKNNRKNIKEIYKIKYPKDELYGLQSQIRRAIVSVSLNIVEGNKRGSSKDYLRFCYIARGSLEEVKECLLITDELYNIKISGEYIDIVGKQLSNLIKYLKSNVQCQ